MHGLNTTTWAPQLVLSSSPTPPTHPRSQEQLQFPETGETHAPIFSLGSVQYTLPAPLVSLVVSSDILAMGLASNTVILIELTHEEQVVQIQIPGRKPPDMTLYKIFLDPSGRHLIITSTQGENWYLFRGWKKPKLLKSFKMVIESVAWNKAALLSSSHSTSTREILIGARNGAIYEGVIDAEEDFFKTADRYLQSVFSLPERPPITGIKFDFFPPSDGKKALVVVTTPSRIYQFVGAPNRRSEEGGRVFTALFAAYKDTPPSECSDSSLVSHVSRSVPQRSKNYPGTCSTPSCTFTPQTPTRPCRYPKPWAG